MTQQPHPDTSNYMVTCAVLTTSDTRTTETDTSGQLIQDLLNAAQHRINYYQVIPDEPTLIQSELSTLGQRDDIEAIILNGGTGIAKRDTTYDVVEKLLTKTLPGFGEIFRYLSYQEIGSRAIASRAVAGVYHNKLIFSLPGSRNAVRLGMEKLILPEIIHLVKQL
ncbi:MogA/MoaB family molybdenum cofactor biosynthesis protein [Calothrix sp. NIES-3974]|uniref:MogA/MoaB family molybdenum cofactor biosynthesis protein n=1 Tax=Calothrix sp. NIES-3974 TaxID=2005462 RepID=UPI000B6088FE|nr:MogA/MoaB family molybdenum cofactor biosynthesis protein [Calothrix sp. NIES-3974]BAZ05528.1 molybdenum cofactor synthesis domain-containing protein [Calothrix sp. NIES-3974]